MPNIPPDQKSPYGPQQPQERQPGGGVPVREPDAILGSVVPDRAGQGE